MTKREKLLRPLRGAFLGILVVTAIGCEELLKVENPGQIPEEALAGEGALTTLVNGVYGDLQNAFDDAVMYSALFSDETVHSGSFPTSRQIDQRAIALENTELLGFFTTQMVARFTSDQAIARLREALGAGAANSALMAELLMLAGFIRLQIAQNFCEAPIDAGPALPSQVFYEQAEALFTEAITVAAAAGTAAGQSATAPNIRLAALVGRARARLALGNNAGAAADADLVPAAFNFLIIYADTSGRERNVVVTFTVTRREYSMGQPYWNDPRIPQCSSNPARNPAIVPTCPFTTEGALGPDNATPLFVQLKYPDLGADIPLASGEQAAYVAREARGENVSAAKAADTYLEGLRLGDMRRRNDPFLAGGMACFPIPQREIDTNPNL